MTPHTIHARLTYARHSVADGYCPDVALLDLQEKIHMLKAPPSPTIFRPIDAATKLAAELQANDPDWTYTVEPRGEGQAVILCHDEDGHLIHCGM